MLSLVLYFTLNLGFSAQGKSEAHSSAIRGGIVVFAAVEAELKDAQVITPAVSATPVPPSDTLVFRHPLYGSDGNLVVDSAGLPTWGSDQTLRYQGNLLKLENVDGQRVLKRLGDGSDVRFQRIGTRQLSVEVLSRDTDSRRREDNAVHRYLRRISLPNST